MMTHSTSSDSTAVQNLTPCNNSENTGLRTIQPPKWDMGALPTNFHADNEFYRKSYIDITCSYRC